MANNTMTRYSQPGSVATLADAMDQIFREAFTWPSMFGTAQVPRRGYGLGLNSNLYETNDSYVLQIVLPGVAVESLQINAHRNVVALSGTTGVAAPEGARSIWVGLGGGEFREQMTLPGEVDADKAEADYRDGILTLTLPKAESSRVKTIKIGTHANQAIEGEKK